MQNQNDNDVIEIDLMEMLGLLLSRIWVIIGIGILTAAVGFSISTFLISPTYKSTTKIYILNKTDSNSINYSDLQMGTQLTKDYAELINSRYVLESVIEKYSLNTDYEAFKKCVSVETPSDTRIVAITVEYGNPSDAMYLADAVREIASEHIQNVMDIEAVNVVEQANMPTEPASPDIIKWTAIAGVLGVLFVSAYIIVKYLLDDTIKTSDDVEKYLGLSTLALIPLADDENTSRKKKRKKSK
ncbi:YveK family protein [Lacrimispora saccharolytica]|uniref:YveK family protein n=1 Tax=Lacrimispora saccharolytica TaxID=84030 RepID=UPI00265C9B57|nr:Wzz/FepE/Etk N-terminal domain-containing protein [Lacrimispora saccharolytica]MCF2657199.1 protein-tyrosine kinase [Lacrimispora saccharolytica]